MSQPTVLAVYRQTLTIVRVKGKLDATNDSLTLDDEMAPRTLATLATVLSGARDADAALTLLQHEASDIDRSAHLALFMCDSRRQLITEKLVPETGGVSRTPMNVAIDHLPAPIRRALNFGTSLADFGPESDDYMKLLGITAQQPGGILSVRGLTLDGELAGFVAMHEAKRRFGPRMVERIAPALDLFALAFERIAEHDARFEAVRALEELTRNIHAEYNRAVRDLKAELTESRANSVPPATRDAVRIADLERTVKEAFVEAVRRGERLTAVEEQVGIAVGKLEQAHIDLHTESQRARADADVIYQVERALAENASGLDASETLTKIQAALAARV